jgi:pyrroloquinoline quinone biosynthesis protein B
MVLGTAQDGGFPQAGCRRPCCAAARADPGRRRLPASLGIVDPTTRRRWIIDCTPAFPEQLERLDDASDAHWGLSGIFLTHAHMGHYTGLVHLGQEVMATRSLAVYAMDRMGAFLSSDAPWRNLVDQGHIQLHALRAGRPVSLSPTLSITPIEVPHRDEISETVAFRVDGPGRSILHLPDIDGWAQWATPLEEIVAQVDVAWIDGTFFDATELPGRDLSQIAHPFIRDTLDLVAGFPPALRARIRFTHLNHSNPACQPGHGAAAEIRRRGCLVAEERARVSLGAGPEDAAK